MSRLQTEALDKKQCIFEDLERRLFAKFSNNYVSWKKAVHSAAVLDVLLSLADYVRGENTCVPEIHDKKDGKVYIFHF